MCGIHLNTVCNFLLRKPALTLEKGRDLCVIAVLADIESKGINIDQSVQNNASSFRVWKAKPKLKNPNNKSPIQH